VEPSHFGEGAFCLGLGKTHSGECAYGETTDMTREGEGYSSLATPEALRTLELGFIDGLVKECQGGFAFRVQTFCGKSDGRSEDVLWFAVSLDSACWGGA
jgi:hypothetical protein